MGDVEERPAEETPAGGSEQDGGDVEFVDDVIIEGLDEEVEEKPAEKAEKVEKKAAPVEDLTKKELDRLTQKVSDLNKALHTERQAKKSAKEESPPLSKAELTKLMEEYKDDPGTLLQIISYTAEQAAKGASKEVIDQNKVSENKKETDAFLQKNYPDIFKEDSEMRQAVDKTKAEMGLDSHPYGDFVGVAVQMLINAPSIIKQVYDRGRNDALSGKAEKTRREVVKESGLTPKGKSQPKESSTLTDSQKDVASKLGLTGSKLRTFEKIVGKNAKIISVEG
jgi:hypothetical protein